MAQKSITREEATYTLVDGHFAIDCACGSRKGVKFSDESTQEIYDLSNTFRNKHTFYANKYLVKELFYFAKEDGKKELEITCNGCKREFLLTSELYQEIIDKIRE